MTATIFLLFLLGFALSLAECSFLSISVLEKPVSLRPRVNFKGFGSSRSAGRLHIDGTRVEASTSPEDGTGGVTPGDKPSKIREIEVNADSILDEAQRTRLLELIRRRADARWRGDYRAADAARVDIERIALPAGIKLLLEDIPRSKGGGSKWKLVYQLEVFVDDLETSPSLSLLSASATKKKRPSVLNLAHAALGMSVSCSERAVNVPVDQLSHLVINGHQQY